MGITGNEADFRTVLLIAIATAIAAVPALLIRARTFVVHMFVHIVSFLRDD